MIRQLFRRGSKERERALGKALRAKRLENEAHAGAGAVTVLVRKSLTMSALSNSFEYATPFAPKSGLVCLLLLLRQPPRLACNLSVGFQSDPNISPIITSTMIITSTHFSASGIPKHLHGVLLHTMSGSELSRVQTELFV